MQSWFKDTSTLETNLYFVLTDKAADKPLKLLLRTT